ncbi:MAG TPA: prepilin-type N-terminal cleavage/methylation domain-containing protein [Povalibacter sp.]
MSRRLAHIYKTACFASGAGFRGRASSRAFTLLELLAAVAVVGLLAGIAVPTYSRILQSQKTTTAVRDLGLISLALEKYRTAHAELPMSLADVGLSDLRDPWGNPYQYLNFDADIPGINGLIRKDHNLHPINSDFDLYSKGPDGDSRAPLTARASRDDIVFARDGSFIGPAEDF